MSLVLEEERKIKLEGKDAWKAYENKIMLDNAEGWFKDADKEDGGSGAFYIYLKRKKKS